MPADRKNRERAAWVITIAAAAILMVTMGARQSLGLFVAPLRFGDYHWIWYADMALAAAAALINLPIREAGTVQASPA